MLVDRVSVKICAGDGGNGIVAWRREKYIPKGGPAGGDGGKGGDVTVVVDPNVCGLDYFRHLTIIRAENGKKGLGKGCKGANGEDIILHIPPGTIVRDVGTGEILFDGVIYNDSFLLCRGGKGGLGNIHFKTPSNRAPQIATPGEEGEQKEIEFELKLIGDVGFVGFPNAGKSTLLQKLTYTQVAIAPYPFTTLSPNLGYISYEGGTRVLLTDIPGIIEGAHQNKGLGLEFLRHIERTKMLLFVLDAAGVDGRDPTSDYKALCYELAQYDSTLLQKPSAIILNKIDLPESVDMIRSFREHIHHPHIIEASFEEGVHLDAIKACIYTLLFEGETTNELKRPREETFLKIKAVLEKHVLPELLLDGGGVQAVSMVDDETVAIEYSGACACCPMALTGTLSFIQEILWEHVGPSIRVVPSFMSQEGLCTIE